MVRNAPWIRGLTSVVGPTCLLVILAAAISVQAESPIRQTNRNQPAPEMPPLVAPHEVEARVLDPTQIVAVVGDQVILAGEMLPTVNQMTEEFKGQAPEAELNRQRVLLMQQMLPRKIEGKLVYLDFLRTFPEDKVKEALESINKEIDTQFFEDHVDSIMEQMEVKSLAELETKLRSLGSSLERQKQEYREQAISRSMVGRQVENVDEIPHEQLLEEYRKDSKKYDIPGRARWEKLTVLFSKFPDRASAERAIAEMGNQVLRGAPLAAVAKRHSQGTNAAEGGHHDWTTRGSLVSTMIDEAIFSLQPGELSRIREDERGFHIIRVIEREDARRIGFSEAQDDIRKRLEGEQRQEKVKEYLQQLRENTYTWTAFDK